MRRLVLVIRLSGLLALVGCSSEVVKSEESVQHKAEQLQVSTQINSFAVLANGRATFGDRTVLAGGDVGATATSGDAVTAGSAAVFALGRSTIGTRVVLKERAKAGDLFANSVSAPLATYTSLSAYAAPPAAPPIATFTAGTTPITANAPTTLAAGNYGTVTVNSTLTLSGGTYQIQNLVLGNNAVVQANAATSVRVAGRISGTTSNHVRLVATGSQPASNLRFIVAGATNTTGGVSLGTDAEVKALIVSRAAFLAADRLSFTGALAAGNVTVGNDSHVTFANGFECNADAACDDSNSCTADSCVDAKCVHTAAPNGTACASDDNDCTVDQCSAGQCVHTAVADGTACADDGSTCTTDACQSGVCEHPARPDGTPCIDDNNDCTQDQCGAGLCRHDLLPDVGHCAAADAVTPFFTCYLDPGNGVRRAVFGFDNPTGSTVYVQAGTGNDVIPAPNFRGQPEQFVAGHVEAAFVADFTGNSIAWRVGSKTASFDPFGPRCEGSICPGGCAAGEYCVQGQCQASCGDHICSHEDCTTCPTDCSCSQASKIKLVDRPTDVSPTALAQLVPDTTTSAFTTLPEPVFGGNDSGGLMSFATGPDEDGAVIAFDALPAVNGPFTFHIDSLNYNQSEGACGSVDPYVKNLTINGVSFGGASQGTVQVPRDQHTVSVHVEIWDDDDFLCFGDEHLATFDLEVDNYDPVPTCSNGGGGSMCWTATGSENPGVCFDWNAQFIDAGPWNGVAAEDFFASKATQKVPAAFARMDATIKRKDPSTNAETIVYQFGGFLDEDGCIPRSRAPNRELWAPGGGIFATFKLASQFCLDPTGFDCLPDQSSTPPKTTGANAIIFPASATGPGQICAVVTEDSTLVMDPACTGNIQAVTWTGAPPNPIRPANMEQNATTRASAVLSHIFGREAKTDGGLGVQNALITRRAEGDDRVEIQVDTFCCLDDAGRGFDCNDARVTKRTSCRSGGRLLLEPDGANISGTRFKYVVAHEFGHFIQGNAQGLMAQDYNAPGLSGRGARCECAVVPGDENLHCLQSLEEPNAAQIEGFAQYYAAKVWNDDTQNDCTFVYYKNFGDTTCWPGVTDCVNDAASGLINNKPPMPVSCVQPVRWRNTNCLGASPSDALLASGTEFDWLEFLYGIGQNATPAARWSMQDVFNAYVVACGDNTPANAQRCTGGNVSWAGSTTAKSLRDGAAGLKGASSAATLAFQAAGNTFGISNTP